MNSSKGLKNSRHRKIRQAATDILQISKQRKPNSPYYRTAHSHPSYELAKTAQTHERNLNKAALLYAEAARKGEKVDSCIKDFASIVHQMGETQIAVRFLKDARAYYQGDINKYDRLVSTLERQLQPSGKHLCKSILLEMPEPLAPSPDLISSIFANTSRVKTVRVYSNLNFSRETDTMGKWVILDFESFSAAKKTLEKLNYEEWFGLNKFWLRDNLVVCLATDGREDFEQGLVVGEEMLLKRLRKSVEWFLGEDSRDQAQRLNRLAIGLIERAEMLSDSSESEQG